MSEIADFLNQQYDRIEERSRAAMHGGRGVWTHIDPIRRTGAIMDDCGETVVYDEGSPTGEQAEHIVANDPAHVLADIESKRRILDEVVGEATSLDMQVDGEFRVGPRDEVAEPYLGDKLLRLLAAPFSSEPGYKEEWAV